MNHEIKVVEFTNDEHSRSLKIDNVDIPNTVIKEILLKEDCFDTLLKFAENGGTLNLTWEDGYITFSKRDRMFKCIELFKLAGLLGESSEFDEKIATLKNALSVQNYISKLGQNVYTLNIEGENYTVEVGTFFKVLTTDDNSFENIANKPEIAGINTRYFFYMMHSYFKDNKIPDDFIDGEKISSRLNKIRTYGVVDFQSVNLLTENDEKIYNMISIDPSIEEEVWNKRPVDLNPLEQAIYIYIKMCLLFDYDEKFYASNQKGNVALKHKSLDYIKNISTSNNRLVCFEFTAIYAQFLSRLGLHFKSHYEKGGEETYGEGHTYLLFKYDKFLINADSVPFILKSDMFLAKIAEPLTGFTCANLNNETKKEFKKIFNKVYDLVKKEMRTGEVNFDMLVRQYESKTDSIREMDIFEKFEIFKDLVQNSNLKGIDLLSYMLYLKKMMNQKDMKKFNVTVIRSIGEDGEYYPIGIVILNPVDYDEAPELNQYYFLNQNKELKTIEYSSLKSKFKDVSWEYIEEGSPKIPGI